MSAPALAPRMLAELLGSASLVRALYPGVSPADAAALVLAQLERDDLASTTASPR